MTATAQLYKSVTVDEIAAEYALAIRSLTDSLRNYHRCGVLLNAKKATLPHGDWLPWLRDNEQTLGFGERNAQRMMDFANTTLASDLDGQRALTLGRELWGHSVPQKTGYSMSIHYSSETDEWATPQGLFDVLRVEFNFTLDVCATAGNAKCQQFYSETDDGLTKHWSGSCWMNPPYGDEIGKWVAKAFESAKSGAKVTCLLPARVDTGWWWDYCRFGEIRFIRGRLKFGGGENSAPFPSAVVVFPSKPRVIWWEGWNDK